MLQRDYIQRLIREFMAALQRLIEKKEVGQRQEEVRRLFFHTGSIDDVMRWFERYHEEERLDRMSMLAELYYAEADTMSEPVRTEVLDRAFMLFDFIDRHSRTYSPERLKKMNEITEKVRK